MKTYDEIKADLIKARYPDWDVDVWNYNESGSDVWNDLTREAALLYGEAKWNECYLRTCDNIKIKTLFTFDCEKPPFKP